MAKKFEALFRIEYIIDKSQETDLKKFLESEIKNLKVSNIELYPAAQVLKAIVGSNLKSLIPPKDQDYQSMSIELSKLKTQLASQTTKNLAPKDEVMKMFQEQIMQMSQQLGEIDNERTKLTNENKLLMQKITDLTLELAKAQTPKAILDESGSSSPSKRISNLENKLKQQESAINEERVMMQENMNQLSAKLVDMMAKNNQLEMQLKKGGSPIKGDPLFDKDKEALVKELQQKNQELEIRRSNVKNLTVRKQELEKEKAELQARIDELLKGNSWAGISAQNKEETEGLKKQIEELTKKIEKLESEIKEKVKENEYLLKTNNELKIKCEEMNKTKEELLQKVIKSEELKKEYDAKENNFMFLSFIHIEITRVKSKVKNVSIN